MKDSKYVVIFIAIGLALAYFVGAPLREDSAGQPQIGTPLDRGQLYAEGTVALDPSIAASVQNYPALFIFIRTPEGGGPPIAVRRITSPQFPVSFTLTEQDNMAGEGFYDGDISVVARLDQDGAAGPRQEGDVEAKASIIKDGNREVRLTLVR